MPPRWPLPPVEPGPEPHYLLLLSLPYAGSTAIAKLLESSSAITGLTSTCEGQWLIPGLCGADRWNPDLEVDPVSIRAVWTSRFQQRRKDKPGARFVIEKSPPNMVRIGRLQEALGGASILVNNRDPHAQCASALRRGYDTKGLDREARREIVAHLSDLWRERSRGLMELVQAAGLPRITYEAFCADPSCVVEGFGLLGLGVEDVNPSATIRVKDYPSRPVTDQNDRQLQLLTAEDVDVVNGRLVSDPEVLTFFGYPLRDPVRRAPVDPPPRPTAPG